LRGYFTVRRIVDRANKKRFTGRNCLATGGGDAGETVLGSKGVSASVRNAPSELDPSDESGRG